MKLLDRVRSTMKSEETEGRFELFVTRTPGYLWALLFRRLGVHPIVVTLLSLVIGAAAGFFFYFTSVWLNVVGMLLLVWANWYDCADGQLARMTGQTTLTGRVLDGFAGDVWFFSIYFFLCLRLTPQWGVWIWFVAAFSGFYCHAKQCQLADYYRNIHLYFQLGTSGSELSSSAQQRERFEVLDRRHDWFERLYLFFYMSYTRSQEHMTPAFQRFRAALQQNHGDATPTVLREAFCQGSRPLMPWCNVLTFDTRVGVLFLSLLAGVPWLFFVFEILVLEPLRFWVRSRHERLCTDLTRQFSLI